MGPNPGKNLYPFWGTYSSTTAWSPISANRGRGRGSVPDSGQIGPRGRGRGSVPASGQIGDGRPVPVPGQIGDGDGDGDRGVRALIMMLENRTVGPAP
jgi:hypothetical protein